MRAYLLLTFLATTSAFSVSYVPQAKGRKLFGGYRIVPKECKATHPSRIVSDDPPICMFNHECKRHNGDVVGACMDGFLFGACCQLRSKQSAMIMNENNPMIGSEQSIYEVDHVPDIPILLNPDGTPVGLEIPPRDVAKPVTLDGSDTSRPSLLTLSDVLANTGNTYTKTSGQQSKPWPTNDASANSEKTQLPQADFSNLESEFPALLHQQSILDDLRLPSLLTHSVSNNDVQEQQGSPGLNPVTTFLNSDQVLQIADPVDQLPILFSQGISHNDYSSAETVLLNENGTIVNENNNPDDLFVPGIYKESNTITHGSTRPQITSTTHLVEQVTQKVFTLTSQLPSSSTKLAPSSSATTEKSTVTKSASSSVSYERYSLPSRPPTTATKVPSTSKSPPAKTSPSTISTSANTTPQTASTAQYSATKLTTLKTTPQTVSTTKQPSTTPMPLRTTQQMVSAAQQSSTTLTVPKIVQQTVYTPEHSSTTLSAPKTTQKTTPTAQPSSTTLTSLKTTQQTVSTAGQPSTTLVAPKTTQQTLPAEESPTTRLATMKTTHPQTQSTEAQSSTTLSLPKSTPVTTIEEAPPQKVTKYVSTLETTATTPMTSTSGMEDDDLIRIQTIAYPTSSENKKHDVTNQEEDSISHIISLLDDTNRTPEPEPLPLPEPNEHPDPHDENSGIQTWASIEETTVKPTVINQHFSKPGPTPATFPYTYYRPYQTSNYYDYEVTRTETPLLVNTHAVPLNTYPSASSIQDSYYGSSAINDYQNRPSTNPPAPTVIVLGPLGTEYTTKISPETPPRRPVATLSTNITKKPTFSTTVTHNINTLISTNNANATPTKVVSTSYITVDLQDGTTSTKPLVVSSETTINPENAKPLRDDVQTERPETTVYQQIVTKKPVPTTVIPIISSTKPSFYLKPYTNRPGAATSTWTQPTGTIVLNEVPETTPQLEEETTAPEDLSNFPPVRNPNLNLTLPASQQEKPTISETFNNTFYPDLEVIDEDDIPTPPFIEDDVLKSKVDVFVNKIVASLQDSFSDLKDVVYKPRNTTTTTTQTPPRPSVTKRPTTSASSTTTRKPIRRPTTPTSQTPGKPATPSKRPPLRTSSTTPKTVTTAKPTNPVRVSTTRPKPTTQSVTTTRAPQTVTKRPKPTRRPTTTVTTAAPLADETEPPIVQSTQVFSTSHRPDFRTECGVRPLVKTGRIVGGKGAKFGEWPWQVLVREATWLGLFTKNKCGGVLITNKYVITAAHCQPGLFASLVAVFGEFDISGELEPKRSVSRNVRRVVVHRSYNPATFENDLALLELETPVQFDSHIVPICMPEDNADFTGRMATVTGWGRLKYNGGVPSVLQEVKVPIIENSVCQEMFQTTNHPKLILESFLCAGYANGQKDSCEGDSGGPLMLERPDGRWELVGTVSHGIKCAAPYLPGVYMRTTFFKPWLHAVTGV